MKLTNEQYEFFKDLDVSEAVKHGEGRVLFTFPHRGRVVEVNPCSLWNSDILVRHEIAEDDSIRIDRSLSLFDIPETENLSGPALLKLLYDAVHSRPESLFRTAWINTPHVKQWPVDVLGTRIRFAYQNGSVTYELWAHEAQEIQEVTTVVLLVGGQQVHTFLLPMRYCRQPSVQFVYELANAVAAAWRDEVGM